MITSAYSLVTRRMAAFLLVVFATFPVLAPAQQIPDFHDRSAFLLAPPGSFDYGLVGFANPANLGLLTSAEARFVLSTKRRETAEFDRGGLFLGLPGIGLSWSRQTFALGRLDNFKVSIAQGSPEWALGFGYGWSRQSESTSLRPDKILSAGLIARPNPFLSLGAVGNFSIDSDAREAIFDIGIRPFERDLITLFGDAALKNGTKPDEIRWSVGLILGLATGLDLVGRYFDTDAMTVGLAANFGRTGLQAQSRFDSDGNHGNNTYMLRRGAMRPRVRGQEFGRGRYYTVIDLNGRIDYHRYQYFDKATKPLYPILRDIQAAGTDPRIRIIVVNLSGMRALPEHAWEIREALRHARQAQKQIIAFIDAAGTTAYHLASVADWVVMDPQGSLLLPGFALSKTYVKGTLEKLGLGFDAWRFFEYKSAVEVLSRDRMSAADSLQNQAYLDDRYELVRGEICAARELSLPAFDQIVNEQVFVLAKSARDQNLVDELGRFSSLDELIRQFTGGRLRRLAAADLYDNALVDERWGPKKRIALVYGLGVCAMDSGIRARWLERIFLRLMSDNSVAAVVFRVDSPGGDGMASDVVAEALKKCAQRKPVIVSQGQVAGSGGYWISMNASRIVASPITVTGSIGVIGGWLYDSGFSDRIGMSSDLVQVGDHADLWRGVQLPLLGTIPARNLTAAERSRMETLMRSFYDDFVTKVAQGRKMPVTTVREIAEGRIYSGLDGKGVGLVDEMGGLLHAIKVAREEAGIPAIEPHTLIEIPQYKGLLNLGLPALPYKAATPFDPILAFIKMVADHAGQPLLMLLPGQYPDFE